MTASATATLKVTIQRGQQPARELSLTSREVLVGSAAHCEVRVDDTDAAPEQLLLEVLDQGVVARSRSRQHGVLVDGLAFSEGPLNATSIVQVGQTRLKVEVAPCVLARGSTRRPGSRLWVYGLACLGFPLSLYLIFVTPGGDAGTAKRVEPPALFGEAREACPTAIASEARFAAESELVLAEALRERAPFHPEDGVKAVGHYGVAAACYRVAGEAESASVVSTDVTALRESIQQSFHVHRARLDYALSTQRYDRASTEVRTLLAFLGSGSSEYKTRLKSMEHQLQLKHAASGSKTQ